MKTQLIACAVFIVIAGGAILVGYCLRPRKREVQVKPEYPDSNEEVSADADAET